MLSKELPQCLHGKSVKINNQNGGASRWSPASCVATPSFLAFLAGSRRSNISFSVRQQSVQSASLIR
jgi:hypothetical protein